MHEKGPVPMAQFPVTCIASKLRNVLVPGSTAGLQQPPTGKLSNLIYTSPGIIFGAYFSGDDNREDDIHEGQEADCGGEDGGKPVFLLVKPLFNGPAQKSAKVNDLSDTQAVDKEMSAIQPATIGSIYSPIICICFQSIETFAR